MSHAAQKKRDQRQRKRLGQVVLQVPIYDLVAFLDQLILEGRLDEEDSDNWSAICEATGGLLYRYYRQRETIVPRDPSEFVYGPRYGATFIDHRTGLLQRQKSPKDDEPWELIKKAVKQEFESEEYLVVLSDEAAETANLIVPASRKRPNPRTNWAISSTRWTTLPTIVNRTPKTSRMNLTECVPLDSGQSEIFG